MYIDNNNLIWIDLEMTGLNPACNRIIEIASVVTNSHLKILDIGPVLAINQSESDLNMMDNWNLSTHITSGLMERVKNSTLSENEAEEQTINFLSQWIDCGKSPICGNNVSHDKRFLLQYMPKLAAYFHYRCLDVSTLKELAKRWKPDIFNKIKKNNSHQALNDIKESISELIYYRDNFISL